MGRHLLVAVDGSSASREAFEFALDQSPDATLTIVHVINPMSSFSYSDDDYFDLEGYQREEQRRRESAEQLHKGREKAHGFSRGMNPVHSSPQPPSKARAGVGGRFLISDNADIDGCAPRI